MLFGADARSAREEPPATGVVALPLSPKQLPRAAPPEAGARGGPLGARLVRAVLLRDRPGARILRCLAPRTEFGSQRVPLVDGRAASPYGCCVLALTGRQPNVPQGWKGGNRLAIHGTPNVRTLWIG